MKILVTGASGFIGSFIVEEALRRDMEVWAAVRKSSSKKYLTDERINFIELNLSSEDDLRQQLAGHEFDYVVHAAGATKCLHKSDFYKINTDGTKNLVNALISLRTPIKRFIYLSSLSIFGAIREKSPYMEIEEDDIPRPNTAYGKSKLMAEKFLDTIGNDFPYVILRPTGVYGPREKDYFMMAKTIKSHIDFSVGFKHQDITFIYVQDLVQAVFLTFNRGKNGRKYFLSDGNVYNSKEFSDYIHGNLGHPWWIRIKAPLFILRLATFVGEYIGRITGKTSALNNDKYNILQQRNWRCNIEPAVDELGFHPHYNLKCGTEIAIKWYKDNNWL